MVNDAERCVNGDSCVGKSVSGDEEDKNEEERLEPKQKLKGKKAKDARKRAKEASSAAEPEAKVRKCQVYMTFILFVKNKVNGFLYYRGDKLMGKQNKSKTTLYFF